MLVNERQDQYWLMKYKITVGQVWVQVLGVGLVVLGGVKISVVRIPYRCARFTPPCAKYLILDDFHFRIDPQIINYNGLSFHTSMGLPELGRAFSHLHRRIN